MENENVKNISPERITLFENEIAENRKNRKSNFIFRTIFFSIILFSICLLPFLPPFSCENMELRGNYRLTEQDILALGNYKKSTPLLLVDDKLLEKEISKLEYVKEVEVDWSIFGLQININELACLLKENVAGEIKYVLSDGSYLTDFKAINPSSTYDFKENEVPLIISDFSFENSLGEKDTQRKLRLLENLKEISFKILSKSSYFDISYNQDKTSLLFGLYFKEGATYHRILMRDEAFAYFLQERRFEQIINAINNTSDKNVYKHDTINELTYTNTVCGYDGTNNVCRVSAKSGTEDIL